MTLEFDESSNHEPRFRSRVVFGQEQRPKMLDILLKTGLVKDEKAAGIVLVVGAAVIFITSLFVFGYVFSEPESDAKVIPPELLTLPKQ